VLDEQHDDAPELAGIPGLVQALFRLARSRTPETMNAVVGILAGAIEATHAELQRPFLMSLLQGLLPARLPGIETSGDERFERGTCHVARTGEGVD